MKIIDGQSDPFFSGKEAKPAREDGAARPETGSVILSPPKDEKDRVEISVRGKDSISPGNVSSLKDTKPAVSTEAGREIAGKSPDQARKKTTEPPAGTVSSDKASVPSWPAENYNVSISGIQSSIPGTMSEVSSQVDKFTEGLEVSSPYSQETFKKCLPNTLQTTVSLKPDGTTFTITGDIPAMWVRDSCAQIQPYVPMCKDDANLQNVVRGTILRHVKHFNSPAQDAPFINSWKDDYNPWEYKYEPDGVAYLIRLASQYTKTTGDDSWARQTGDFDAHKAFDKALDLIKEKMGPTGLVKCPNRPSDDWTKYPYLIPTNMFLAANMSKLKDMYLNIWNDPARARDCEDICNKISAGIEKYGKYNHPEYGTIWAYEVDDNGNANLMDDANVPSLLAAPYMEFCSPSDPTYKNTRNFVLSKDNPYYVTGTYGSGVGSPHTPGKRVWPMSIIMQALTTNDSKEIQNALASLDKLDAGTHLMHEGVNPDNPGEYSRGWFSWANSLYGEMVISKVLGLNYYPGDGTYIKPNLNPEWNNVALNIPVSYGNISGIKLHASGDGSEIVSATINGKPVTVDPKKGVKITEDLANVEIQTRAS